jgi:CheY-like chemotaxis protein
MHKNRRAPLVNDAVDTIYRVMSGTQDNVSGRQGDKATADGLRPARNDDKVTSWHGERAAPDGPSSAASSPERLRILVAEDNDFNARLLEELLVRRGHQVRLASNGREALCLVGEEVFDLLLLDVHMPELDGFQVVGAVRERERTGGGHLPVVALTARSRKEDRDRCLAAGMDDFLSKPIQATDLWVTIERVLVKKEGYEMHVDKAKDPAPDPSPEHPPAFPDERLLDPCVLLAACGDDAVILEKISQAFLACLPDELTAVRDALRENDTLRLREAAHKLHGMVAAFSSLAGGLASELEDFAIRGELTEAGHMVERLEALGHELTRAVSGLSVDVLREQAAAAGKARLADGQARA